MPIHMSSLVKELKAGSWFFYKGTKKLHPARLKLKNTLAEDRVNILAIDDTAKGGLTQFWELFTVIPCAPKDFKR